MRFKIQIVENGVARDIFVNSARDLVAVRFTPLEIQLISRWPSANHPLVMGPRSFIEKNQEFVNRFVHDWPVEFYSGSHQAPSGSVLGPDGRLLDK